MISIEYSNSTKALNFSVCSGWLLPDIDFLAIFTIGHSLDKSHISLRAVVQEFAFDCLIWQHIRTLSLLLGQSRQLALH